MMILAATALSVWLQAAPPSTSQPRAARWFQIASGWDDLSPTQRDRALHNYQSYLAMPPDKRKDIDKHYEKWKQLPPSDQDRYRQKHQQYRAAHPDDD